MNKEKTTAIIILNYINYIQTIECVDRLINIGIEDYIVIVDNNSSNESFRILTEKYIKNKNIYVIKTEKNLGYSGGNNFGLNYLKYINDNIRYVGIMNPDVLLNSKNTIIDNISILKRHEEYAAITSLMEQEGKKNIGMTGWNLPSILDILISDTLILSKFLSKIPSKELLLETNQIRVVEALHGSFFIIKYDIFEKVGFFDDNVFMYYEENILGKKLKGIGYKLAINKGDYYLHNHRYNEMNVNQAQKSALWRKRSQQYYLKKYLKINIFIRLSILLIYNIYIYVELPLVKLIKRWFGDKIWK